MLRSNRSRGIGRPSFSARPSVAATAFASVTFDGANDYMTRGGALTGLTDGQQFTFGWRGTLNAAGNGSFRVLYKHGDNRFYVQLTSANRIAVIGANASGTTILSLLPSDTYTDATGEIALLVSADLSVPTASAYVNGVDVTDTPLTLTNDTIDFTPTDIGAFATSAGSAKFAGTTQFLYFDDAYLDLSVSANRDKFLAANIGADGSGPTGVQPLVYLTGNAAAWNSVSGLNLGTGGAFTMTGEVANA